MGRLLRKTHSNTVKLALRKTVGRATLFRDELETLLIEIEGVLNSRPLTYIFSEFNEPEPLTPSHMILGRRVNSLPPARLNFNSNLSNRKVLIKRFNYRERLLNMFWTKWSKEYICMLKSAHCAKPTGEIKEFKIDDVVLINDEKFPRHFWKLGKVVDVFPGRDGKIRSSTRGLLATDHVILNHGQGTWTTPELAPPLLTTTPHQREDVSALDRFNVHRLPYTAGL
ncbi:integrase catalytic domain-containing protein [Trichonephila clavipes]|nr:integrase catalytic domain-containing protein [Trichonephila clavipes]